MRAVNTRERQELIAGNLRRTATNIVLIFARGSALSDERCETYSLHF